MVPGLHVNHRRAIAGLALALGLVAAVPAGAQDDTTSTTPPSTILPDPTSTTAPSTSEPAPSTTAPPTTAPPPTAAPTTAPPTTSPPPTEAPTTTTTAPPQAPPTAPTTTIDVAVGERIAQDTPDLTAIVWLFVLGVLGTAGILAGGYLRNRR